MQFAFIDNILGGGAGEGKGQNLHNCLSQKKLC